MPMSSSAAAFRSRFELETGLSADLQEQQNALLAARGLDLCSLTPGAASCRAPLF